MNDTDIKDTMVEAKKFEPPKDKHPVDRRDVPEPPRADETTEGMPS